MLKCGMISRTRIISSLTGRIFVFIPPSWIDWLCFFCEFSYCWRAETWSGQTCDGAGRRRQRGAAAGTLRGDAALRRSIPPTPKWECTNRFLKLEKKLNTTWGRNMDEISNINLNINRLNFLKKNSTSEISSEDFSFIKFVLSKISLTNFTENLAHWINWTDYVSNLLCRNLLMSDPNWAAISSIPLWISWSPP